MRFSKCLSKIVLLNLLIIQQLQAQITYPNVIQDEVIEVPGITADSQIYGLNYQQKITSHKFLDGLGRLIQSVAVQASPSQKDIITYNAFNNLGQQVYQYLPYVGNDGSGAYHSTSATDQLSFYANGLSDKVIDDSKPWMQHVIEGSPLQRILSSGMSGTGFQPISGDHYKIMNYRSNNSTAYSNDGLNSGIRVWNYDGTSTSVYPTGSLSVTELTDELGNLTIVYKDASDRTILKRQIISAQVIDGNTEYCLDTYYVYDDANELRVIIPPKALTAIRIANPPTWNISVAGAVPLVFQFNYDNLGRLVEKKVPGANIVNIVYDPMNRPVLMQNGNLQSSNKWLYFKYDSKERIVSQGVYTDAVNGTSRTNMQNYVNGLNYSTNYYEEKQTGGTAPNFYTNRIFPTTNQDGSAFQDLVYSYYDDYDFNNDGTADYSYQAQGLNGEAAPTNLTRNLATGVYKKTLNNDNTLSVWLHTITFYDKRGNAIQTISNNHTNTAVTDIKTSVPDFIGKIVRAKITKTVNSITTTVLDTLGYDYFNRLITIDESDNGGSIIRIANYVYNELGQLVTKKLHSTDDVSYSQNVDYRYNINQKLTSINNSTLSIDNTNFTNSDGNDLFGEEILYEKTDAGIANTGYYNGNISGIKWEAQSTANNSQRSYIYTYDQLNRLTNAYYKDRPYQNAGSWVNAGLNDEKSIQYDLQGNIEKLTRYFNNASAPIDNLTYSYLPNSGNQLINVSDAGTSSGFNGSNSNPYVYDMNGNLVTDPKKGSAGTTIAYNSLNKTDKISFSSTTSYIRYTYDALGAILRKEAYNGSTTTTYDYIDGFVYQNLSLSYFSTAEGRVRNNSGTLVFEYFIRDHLGNVRVSFDGTSSSAVVRQENSYYPFGMLMPQSLIPTQANNNLFNGGAELQNDLGNLPDYYQTPNRNYDAVLGRFMAIDLLAANYNSLTPYQFALNNPIYNNDPSGLYTSSMAHTMAETDAMGEYLSMVYLGSAGGGANMDVAMDMILGMEGNTPHLTANYFADQERKAQTRYKYFPTNSTYANSAYTNSAIYVTNYYAGTTAIFDGVDVAYYGLSYANGAPSINSAGVWNAAIAVEKTVDAVDLLNTGVDGALEHLDKYSKFDGELKTFTGRLGLVIAAYKIQTAVVKDGGRFGNNTRIEVDKTAGGIVGAYAGAEVGAGVGAFFGGFFFGVGAVPGAAVGAFVGGIVGSIWGTNVGESVGENQHE
jgi:RHS repeat-associated protein